MDPWRLHAQRSPWNWTLFAVRYAIIVGAVGGWLLNIELSTPYGATVAAALSLLLVLDLVALSRPGTWFATGVLAVQMMLVLAALGDRASFPLVGVAVAVMLGLPQACPPPALKPVAVLLPVAAGLRLYLAFDTAAAVYGTAAMLAAGVVAGLLAEAENERRSHHRAREELEAAQARLVEMAARTRELAAAQERQRVLGDIHDAIGHALTATLLQVQVVRRQLATDPAAAEARLADLETSLRSALTEVRQSLRKAIHPAALPLASALQTLVDEVERAGGPHVTLELVPDASAVSDLSPAVTEALYRSAQEALTNAIRHGSARSVRVRAEAHGPRLRLVVADDGAGAENLVPGLGLTAMTARIQALGGTIRFDTGPGRGFTVEIGVRRH